MLVGAYYLASPAQASLWWKWNSPLHCCVGQAELLKLEKNGQFPDDPKLLG
jgi:hypothetical protein